MNHIFKPSKENPDICDFHVRPDNPCGRNTQDHTDKATCEVCGNTGTCDFYCYDTEYLMCMDCLDKERQAAINRGKINNNNHTADEVLNISQKVDQSIQIREDVFNAKTVAIIHLKDAIDKDDNVPNKHDVLAKALEERYNHLSDKIRIRNEETREDLIEQRAIQTYYQELKKKLTEEVQKSIKLKDVNYKPEPAPKKVKAPKLEKKYTKETVRKAAQQSGLPEQAIYFLCTAQGVSAEDAVKILTGAGLKQTGLN